MEGPEDHYALREKFGRAIYALVARSYRVTVEQMALLEPSLSETVCASLLDVMCEAMDEVVRGGVFSDAGNTAIESGKPVLVRDDWKRVFEPDEIAASIQRIT
ncbi:phosphogluconate dehydrogenase C-terminal domain-containing protein [Planktotalea sp.]|uniref:phosphogluconate dehydrogenase C-terminal domain-containing protein n=1 Tax=Planktotalea sp. TaxID=2029877 RepID=UPI0025D60A1A|nr:phosphogluconate dehydrogenase C-terminal domain-containing protein [Planktotalea sp.]